MQRNVGRLLDEKGREVFTVPVDATVFRALEIMADKSVGALVVVDGDERPVGIMSERDYARKVILLDRGSQHTPVSEIMTGDLHTVTEDTTTSECMTLMTQRRIRHLPVLDDGDLVGIISIGDVVRAVIDEQRFLIDQLEQYITQ